MFTYSESLMSLVGSTLGIDFSGRLVDCCTCQMIATHQILDK